MVGIAALRQASAQDSHHKFRHPSGSRKDDRQFCTRRFQVTWLPLGGGPLIVVPEARTLSHARPWNSAQYRYHLLA